MSFGEFATVLWELEKHKNSLAQSEVVENDGLNGNQENGIVNLKINKYDSGGEELNLLKVHESARNVNGEPENESLYSTARQTNQNESKKVVSKQARSTKQQLFSTSLQSTARIRIKPLIQLQTKNSSLLHLKAAGEGNNRSLAEEYGEMLPKTGIYSLPDFKVAAFLRILTDYHRKLEAEERYMEARDAKIKFNELCKIELTRRIGKMQERQALELEKVENI